MNDLVNRVSRLENKLDLAFRLIKNGLKEIAFSLDDFSKTIIEQHANFSFKFNALIGSNATVKIKAETTIASEKIRIYFNGAHIEDFIIENSGEISFRVYLAQGENELLLRLENDLALASVNGSVFGFLSEIDFGSKIEAFNFGGARIVSLYNGAKRQAHLNYLSNEEEYEICSFFDIDGFKFSTIGNRYLVTMEKIQGGFRVRLIDLFTEEIINSSQVDSDCQSYCGAKGNENQAIFYVIEKGVCKKYSFDESLNLVVESTNLFGKEVFSSLDRENVVIVIGFDDKPTIYY